MANEKVTITFDSFNDFQKFLLNPPETRLKQIAKGEVRYAEETTTARPPAPRVKNQVQVVQRVTPQEHVLLVLQRWVAEKKKAMPVKKLTFQACRAIGYRATERAVHSVLWHVHQLVAKKQIRRVSRGMYTIVTGETKVKKE